MSYSRIPSFFLYLKQHIVGAVNLALNKPAEQSHHSDESLYPASKAVNGIYGDPRDFTHTTLNSYIKWWTVNLQSKYSIGRITVCNRASPHICE